MNNETNEFLNIGVVLWPSFFSVVEGWIPLSVSLE